MAIRSLNEVGYLRMLLWGDISTCINHNHICEEKYYSAINSAAVQENNLGNASK